MTLPTLPQRFMVSWSWVEKVRDMTELEQRADTILFTSDPFEYDTDVTGAVQVELFFALVESIRTFTFTSERLIKRLPNTAGGCAAGQY